MKNSWHNVAVRLAWSQSGMTSSTRAWRQLSSTLWSLPRSAVSPGRCVHLTDCVTFWHAHQTDNIAHLVLKFLSVLGGFTTWPPDQGLRPWTPLGAQPPYSHYRLALPHSTWLGPIVPQTNCQNQVQAGDDSLRVLTRTGADVHGGRRSGNLCHCWQVTQYCPLAPGYCQYQEQGPGWGWGVSRSQVQSSGTVYQRPCDPQLSRHWRSLDIWRRTCSADRQRVWGPFMTRSTNLLIIIKQLIALSFAKTKV